MAKGMRLRPLQTDDHPGGDRWREHASPSLIWKTKQTYREKDQIDQIFLRKLLEDRGEWSVT